MQVAITQTGLTLANAKQDSIAVSVTNIMCFLSKDSPELKLITFCQIH